MPIPPGPVDVHGHAMPWGVLRWLEEGGLADLSGADEGVVRIDSVVSGVGPGAPLPLPPSMTDAALRVSELDALGLAAQAISLPPFLMASRSVDAELVREVARRGNDALAQYCAHDDRLIALGIVPLGFEGAADEARALGIPTYAAVDGLNDHPAFIEALANICRKALLPEGAR